MSTNAEIIVPMEGEARLFSSGSKSFLSNTEYGQGEFGSVAWQVSVSVASTGTSVEHAMSYMSGSFRVADCTRSVSIDLYYHDEESYNDRVQKMESLVKEATAARDALVASWEKFKQGQGLPNPRFEPPRQQNPVP